jgi:glycine cleavage system protein P-like pyridoxal-binding family
VSSARGANIASSTTLRMNIATVASKPTTAILEPLTTAISSATAARLLTKPPRMAVQYNPRVLYNRKST